MEYTQEENIIIQSFLNSILFTTLRKNNFFNSSYFKEMEFDANKEIDSWIKTTLQQIEIDNQARLLTALYELLVIPKECLENLFKADFDNLEKEIKSIILEEESNYRYDKDGIKYVRHIRNAVAHANVEFLPNEHVEFLDSYEDKKGNEYKCRIRIPLCNLGVLIRELLTINIKYINSLSEKQK